MQKASGIGRVQDGSDVNVTLGAGVDGYSITYDHASRDRCSMQEVQLLLGSHSVYLS